MNPDQGNLSILHSISTLHTFAGGPRRGEKLDDTSPIENGAVVWDASGKIINVGKTDEIIKQYASPDLNLIDAENKIVTPGLIDSHTHSVNAGSRAYEFVMRCRGAEYMDILNAGGGILNSANKTRGTSQEELEKIGKVSLDRSLRFGVTTIECKSGYGLNTETELKLLRAIKSLRESHPVNINSTFLGAHAIPREYKENPDDYVDLICGEMIPAIAEEKLADFCDVFIEDGVFSVDQGRKILEAGIRHGLKPKVHVDELVPLGGTEMSIELGALSIDHLIAITDDGISKLAESETVGCLLPGTSFFLKKPYAPARKMIDSGCLLAIATDNNPGSSRTENIQWITTASCLYYGLTPAEVFSMVTINAAKALGIDDYTGSIEYGKSADLVIWDAPNMAEIPYHHGHNHVSTIFINGKLM
ncbi:MAG TPA: imidazolonepropionase [bacterium]|jgi:imidazolonepropionase